MTIQETFQTRHLIGFHNTQEIYRYADEIMQQIETFGPIEYQTDVKNFGTKKVEELFSLLLDFEFPLSLGISIPVSDEFFTQCMIEYIKYMILQSLNEYKMVPGFWIDQVWHAHMHNTKNYRDFGSTLKHLCCNIFGSDPKFVDFLAHQLSDGSEEETNMLDEMYELTKQLYESTFCQKWPKEIWKKEGIPTFQVNILGMLLTKEYRKDGEYVELVDKNKSKKAKTLSRISKLSNGFTEGISVLNCNQEFGDIKQDYVRSMIRQLMYDRLRESKDKVLPTDMLSLKTKVMKINGVEIDNKPFLKNNNWRGNYPLNSFDWFEPLIFDSGDRYTIIDEKDIFNEKGFVFVLFLLTHENFSKVKLNKLHQSEIDGAEFFISCIPKQVFLSIDDLADKGESSLDLYPVFQFSQRDGKSFDVAFRRYFS